MACIVDRPGSIVPWGPCTSRRRRLSGLGLAAAFGARRARGRRRARTRGRRGGGHGRGHARRLALRLFLARLHAVLAQRHFLGLIHARKSLLPCNIIAGLYTIAGLLYPLCAASANKKT